MKTLMQVFEMSTSWLVRREKLKPETPEDDASGVQALKAMLEDPAAVVERLHGNPKFRQALRLKGWLPPPARPAHRPTKEQQAEREEYENRQRDLAPEADGDDAQLASMLRGKIT